MTRRWAPRKGSPRGFVQVMWQQATRPRVAKPHSPAGSPGPGRRRSRQHAMIGPWCDGSHTERRPGVRGPLASRSGAARAARSAGDEAGGLEVGAQRRIRRLGQVMPVGEHDHGDRLPAHRSSPSSSPARRHPHRRPRRCRATSRRSRSLLERRQSGHQSAPYTVRSAMGQSSHLRHSRASHPPRPPAESPAPVRPHRSVRHRVARPRIRPDLRPRMSANPDHLGGAAAIAGGRRRWLTGRRGRRRWLTAGVWAQPRADIQPIAASTSDFVPKAIALSSTSNVGRCRSRRSGRPGQCVPRRA